MLPPPPHENLQHCSISVLIPVYNGVKFLAEAVQSVVAQGVEIVVLDDGSTDGTWEILAELAKRHKQVRALRSENLGVARARNRLIAEARGEWITFLDADDILLSSAVANFRQFEAQGEVADIWIADFWAEKQGKKTLFRQLQFAADNPLIPEDLFRMYPMSTVRFYRKEFLSQNALDFGDFRNFEDVIFWYKLIAHKPHVYYSSQPIYVYRIRKNSLSEGQSLTKMQERLRALNYLTEQILPQFAPTCPALLVPTTERVLKTLELSLRSDFTSADRVKLLKIVLPFIEQYFHALVRVLPTLPRPTNLKLHLRALAFLPRQVYFLSKFALKLFPKYPKMAVAFCQIIGCLYRISYGLISKLAQNKPLK